LKLDLPIRCPLIRLEDAGMADQMRDYVTYAVLHHFREFDRYQAQQQAANWQVLPPKNKSDFPIGVLGMGVLGQQIAQDLHARGFPVHAWTRTKRDVQDGIHLFHGTGELDTFLAASQILVCVLPLTPETENILNLNTLKQLRQGAYVINVARGKHLVEEDLLTALDAGHISGATLDVFREEPLPADHPFWHHPRIRITPHSSAITLQKESVQQIANKIKRLEAGLEITGIVDMQRGY